MNDDHRKLTGANRAADDSSQNRTLEALLRLAGPNEPIPDDLRDRVYARARAELPKRSKVRPIIRWTLPAALAATLLLVVLVRGSNEVVPPHPVGSVVLASNSIAAPGEAIMAGDIIDTGVGGGMSIRLRGDISVRVDRNTLVEVESVSKLNLMAGRVYVDTGDRVYPVRKVTIRTATGSATDVGTQFSVDYDRAVMSVAVREGRVDMKDSDAEYSAARGQKVTLRPGQTVAVEDIPVSGPTWDWAMVLAPGFELENSSVLAFLKWVAREKGLELVFRSDDAMAKSMRAKLHGSISGLNPDEALEAVILTTPFSYSTDEHQLVIE
ncbi:MAG: FecR family protein [Gammaproteobacteria bacterium]|nr:FecR family protein [Gammaproteobacteria bacterium]